MIFHVELRIMPARCDGQDGGWSMTRYLEGGRPGYLRFSGNRVAAQILAVRQDTVAVRLCEGPCPDGAAAVELECPQVWGVVAYHMRVVLRPKEDGELLVLQRTSNLLRAERRRAWRVPVHGACDARRHGGSDSFEVQVVDLSTEGTLIETDHPWEIDDMIALRLPLPGSPGELTVGRVIRKDPAELWDGAKPRYGVWFVEVPVQVRRYLTYYVWKRLQELYPEEIAGLFPGSPLHRHMQEQKARLAQRNV